MKKFVVKDTELVKITAQTKLKVGDTVRCKTPSAWRNTDAPITTTIRAIKGAMISGNKIMVKIDEYPKFFDIHYVLEILD